MRRRLKLTMAIPAFALLAWASAAAAQPYPPKTFATAAEVAALMAKAKAEQKPDHSLVLERILTLPPYRLQVVYRTQAGPATMHEKDAELIYVLEGSGQVTLGGKLRNETRIGPADLSGTAIDGGTPRPVAKGDVFIVPENTPHWFTDIKGVLTFMEIHMPETAAPWPK